MIITPKSLNEFALRPLVPGEKRAWWGKNFEGQYAAYRNELVYEFRAKYPEDRRMDFNYTFGFGDRKAEWCNKVDPDGWTLLCHYGHFWPLGFSRPEYLYAFKLRWGAQN
jgi:hypothetical protein